MIHFILIWWIDSTSFPPFPVLSLYLEGVSYWYDFDTLRTYYSRKRKLFFSVLCFTSLFFVTLKISMILKVNKIYLNHKKKNFSFSVSFLLKIPLIAKVLICWHVLFVRFIICYNSLVVKDVIYFLGKTSEIYNPSLWSTYL